MKQISILSAKARLLSEVRTFLCAKCWDYLEMIRLNDLPSYPKCPKCGSSELGILRLDESKLLSLMYKKGEKLSRNEEKIRQQASKTAKLIKKYGKIAAITLSGKNVQFSDAKKILEKVTIQSNHLFELIIEMEKKSLKRKFV